MFAMREGQEPDITNGSEFGCSREDLERQLTRCAEQIITSHGRLISALERLQQFT
jgi:hypothetical protein